jgi:hypothetical protein
MRNINNLRSVLGAFPLENRERINPKSTAFNANPAFSSTYFKAAAPGIQALE